MNLRSLFVSFIVLIASAHVIAADEVVVSVGGYTGLACNSNEARISRHDAGVAFTLDVESIRQTYPGFTHIRIDASSVSDSIGRVTLTNIGANDPEVLLLIADCQQESFPSVPRELGFTLPSRRAATNWGGLVIGSSVDVSKIILAVRIGGNITNTVTAVGSSRWLSMAASTRM